VRPGQGTAAGGLRAAVQIGRGALGAAEALPALRRLQAAGWQDRDVRPSVLGQAIEACSRPDGGDLSHARRRDVTEK